MTLIVKPGFNGMSDPDASAYVTAVEAADGQLLEYAVGNAINSFVLGCKNDGIWDAIKTSCILAGARTLTGALIPLKGTAPTNVGNLFVSGDYDRKTGLVGDGGTKELDTNVSSGLTGLKATNHHLSVYASTVVSSSGFPAYIGADYIRGPIIYRGESVLYAVSFDSINSATGLSASATGFIGLERSRSASFNARAGGATANISADFLAQGSTNLFVFSRGGASPQRSTARIAFYSIGDSLDLSKLDTRISTLITAIGAAI